jgi:hypothetical protein
VTRCGGTHAPRNFDTHSVSGVGSEHHRYCHDCCRLLPDGSRAQALWIWTSDRPAACASISGRGESTADDASSGSCVKKSPRLQGEPPLAGVVCISCALTTYRLLRAEAGQSDKPLGVRHQLRLLIRLYKRDACFFPLLPDHPAANSKRTFGQRSQHKIARQCKALEISQARACHRPIYNDAGILHAFHDDASCRL